MNLKGFSRCTKRYSYRGINAQVSRYLCGNRFSVYTVRLLHDEPVVASMNTYANVRWESVQKYGIASPHLLRICRRNLAVCFVPTAYGLSDLSEDVVGERRVVETPPVSY